MKRNSCSKSLGRIDVCVEEALNRREFLKRQLLGACFFAAGAAGLYLPKRLFASPVPDIGIAKGKPGSATRAAMDLIGGMRTFVKPGAKVVIKPNLSFPQGPEAATTTHPLVTREIVAMCLEAGASRIRVLELERPSRSSRKISSLGLLRKISTGLRPLSAGSSSKRQT